MFDNLLYQPCATQLSADIAQHQLPGAILFSGAAASGKLTCALEVARVLSCTGTPRGSWSCSCPSCRRNKELASPALLLAGSRDCSLEIRAAVRALLHAASAGETYLIACRYLFVRAVRKLTLRFSAVLWEGDDKLPKLAPCLQSIDEQLELLDIGKPLPGQAALEKITAEVLRQAEKLEGGFMYDALPIDQIRRAAAWAHLKSASGKKVFVIESADRMSEGARNALLKTLEEPPEDTIFVLTTAHRGALLPTILSRVRTYTFAVRTAAQQAEVLTRVFHADADTIAAASTIDGYLQTFLPVSPAEVAQQAQTFVQSLATLAVGTAVDVAAVCKACAGFEPRVLLKIFLNRVLVAYEMETASQVALAARAAHLVRDCYDSVRLYNQTVQSALERLWRDLCVDRRMAPRW